MKPSRARVAFVVAAALGCAVAACRAILDIQDLTITNADAAASGDADGGVDDAAGLDATPSPRPPASQDRIACIKRCNADASGPTRNAFYGGAPRDCLCGPVCASDCTEYCDSGRPGVDSCDDCAAHALVDDGGGCHQVACKTAACGDLAKCLAQCSPS